MCTLSTADLTPIPISRTPESPAFPELPTLRNRMEQQVDAIAGSANKVILGVVDTSVGMLRSFLPGNVPHGSTDASASQTEPPSGGVWNSPKPAFGLLRRESGFSIASLAASLPGGRERSKSLLGNGEETGQQLIDVNSRPGSVKSAMMNDDDESSGSEEKTEDETGDDEESEDEDEDGAEVDATPAHDARSIRSFESMMSAGAKERKEASARKSLSDRLLHMPGLSRLSQSDPHKVCFHYSPDDSIRYILCRLRHPDQDDRLCYLPLQRTDLIPLHLLAPNHQHCGCPLLIGGTLNATKMI